MLKLFESIKKKRKHKLDFVRFFFVSRLRPKTSQ